MDRFARSLILLPALLFACFAALLGLAQSPAPSATPSPPAASPPDNRPRANLYPHPTVPGDLTTPPSQKSPLELPPPPGGETVKMPLPPLEAGDLRFPINLATALRLADARPLIIAAAQAGAWVAEARLQKAKVLWVPSLNLGFDYIRRRCNFSRT
jgi:hypothetical protein